MNDIIIEVCATSVDSAIAAERGGAKRIELCDNLDEGGTTPSAGTIIQARKNLSIDLCILIRPRGGDFLYNDIEFSIMKEDILMSKKLGADGVVIGMLDKDGNIDKERVNELIRIARPMQVVFHRAFDMCSDPHKAMEELIELKIDRLLTSGQKKSAIEGAQLISELNEKAAGRIEIMPGSGIKTDNFRGLIHNTNCRNFHLTGREKVNSIMDFRGTGVSLSCSKDNTDFNWMVTSEQTIREIISISNDFKY